MNVVHCLSIICCVPLLAIIILILSRTLPKSWHEVTSCCTAKRYTRPNPKQLGDLKSRKLFRIWHSQSECFMQASCNTEKDRENPKGRASGEASHSPYLKKLPDLRGIPDPSDPSSHYPKVRTYLQTNNNMQVLSLIKIAQM